MKEVSRKLTSSTDNGITTRLHRYQHNHTSKILVKFFTPNSFDYSLCTLPPYLCFFFFFSLSLSLSLSQMLLAFCSEKKSSLTTQETKSEFPTKKEKSN
jgi:hypothetical protein